MNDRDRLAADLHDSLPTHSWPRFTRQVCPGERGHTEQADRLIALGWTRLDEERLARALAETGLMRRYSDYAAHVPTMQDTTNFHTLCAEWAAAVAKAYREDTDA